MVPTLVICFVVWAASVIARSNEEDLGDHRKIKANKSWGKQFRICVQCETHRGGVVKKNALAYGDKEKLLGCRCLEQSYQGRLWILDSAIARH